MLELIEKLDSKYGMYQCPCGKEFKTSHQHVKSEHTKSCGCRKRNRWLTHGMHLLSENQIWRSMKYRCSNPKHKQFYDYGGKGIKVCDSWLNSFENFYRDVGPRPSLLHTLDRKNGNGNYCPDNCRWATKLEQQNNTKSNKFIEYNGKTQTVAQWSRELGLRQSLLHYRLCKQGWSVERAFTTKHTEKYK